MPLNELTGFHFNVPRRLCGPFAESLACDGEEIVELFDVVHSRGDVHETLCHNHTILVVAMSLLQAICHTRLMSARRLTVHTAR